MACKVALWKNAMQSTNLSSRCRWVMPGRVSFDLRQEAGWSNDTGDMSFSKVGHSREYRWKYGNGYA